MTTTVLEPVDLPVLLPATADPDELLLVTVTPDDIDDGVCGDPHRCAIARAADRLLTNGDQARMSSDGTLMIIRRVAVDCMPGVLPRVIGRYRSMGAAMWVRRFDMGMLVEPTNFVFRRVEGPPGSVDG